MQRITLIAALLFPVVLSLPSAARHRERKYAVTGKIVLKGTKPSKPRSAYWIYQDPFAITSRTSSEAYGDLVAVIFKEIGGREVSPKTTVRGMTFVPHTKILNYTQDLEINNEMDEDITVYSPGRVRDRRDLEPQTVSARGSAVFTVGPSDEEAEDHGVRFWAYPLRLKEYPFARGWAVFVRSSYFSGVRKDGTFEIPPLPPGKYTIHFIFRGRLLETKKTITVPKRLRRGKKVNAGVIQLNVEGK